MFIFSWNMVSLVPWTAWEEDRAWGKGLIRCWSSSVRVRRSLDNQLSITDKLPPPLLLHNTDVAGHTSPSNFFNPTTIMNVLGSHSYPSLLNFTAAHLFVVTGHHTCPHTHTSISNLLPIVCQTYIVCMVMLFALLFVSCTFSVLFFYLIPLILKILFSQCCIKNCTPLHHKAFDVCLWYFQ